MDEDQSKINSIRRKVKDKQRDALKRENWNEAILTLGLLISFFGSSAILMPSGGSPTGLFSGDLTVNSPVVQSEQVRSTSYEDGILTFVHDSKVYNPNIVEAEHLKAIYEIKIDGETIMRGSKEGSTVIPGKKSRMIAHLYEFNIKGISSSEEFMKNLKDEGSFTLEGVMRFKSGGEILSEPFRTEVSLE